MRPPVRRVVGDVAAAQPDPPAGRPVEAGQQVEERGLAGPVRADDPQELALERLERDVGDDRRAADVEPEALGGENRRSAHLTPGRPPSYENGLTGGCTFPGEIVCSTFGASRRAVLDELHLEHRLHHRVILRPDALDPLRSEELPALQSRDHLVDVVAVRLADRPRDHLGSDEAVRA